MSRLEILTEDRMRLEKRPTELHEEESQRAQSQYLLEAKRIQKQFEDRKSQEDVVAMKEEIVVALKDELQKIAAAGPDFNYDLKDNHVSARKDVLEEFPCDLSSRRASRWVPDHLHNTCMNCNGRFCWLFVRRHHCRKCGGLFCGKCTKHKVYIGGKKERVCKNCRRETSKYAKAERRPTNESVQHLRNSKSKA